MWFDRVIWQILRRQVILILVMYALGLAGLYASRWLLDVESFSVVELLLVALGGINLQKIPLELNHLLFWIILPALFSFLVTYFCSGLALRLDPRKALSELQRFRSWEWWYIGLSLIRDGTGIAITEVARLRGGAPISYNRIKQICDSLYRKTTAHTVVATCLQSTQKIYDEGETRNYLDHTLEVIRQLSKFTFNRFYVSPFEFEDIFNDNPSDDVKWFVKAHYNANANLIHVSKDAFKEAAESHGINKKHYDVLYCDNSVALSLRTDPSNNFELERVDMNADLYYLHALDDKTDVDKYTLLFEFLENDPRVTDVLSNLEQRNVLDKYL